MKSQSSLILKELKKRYTAVRYSVLNSNESISYYNFWKSQPPAEMWFSRFIRHNKINSNYNEPINFISVLGNTRNISKKRRGTDILFLGENINVERFQKHRQAISNREFDLILGFDNAKAENQLRFPLWLLYIIKPESSYFDVKNKLKELSTIKHINKKKFCALVSSHDMSGIRTQIYDAINNIDRIDSAGLFLNNTNELKTVYNDDKNKFISQYKFNICPENSNEMNYVTEKLFQSLAADCIPIYWGGNGNPEPDVLNVSRMFIWNENSDNDNLIKEIATINSNDKLYNKFVNQPKFTKNASEIIWNYIENLKFKLMEILD